MNTNDLMRAAHNEIRDLRRRNEILEAKVSVMNLFALVLHSKPAEVPTVIQDDILQQLEKHASDMAALDKMSG